MLSDATYYADKQSLFLNIKKLWKMVDETKQGEF